MSIGWTDHYKMGQKHKEFGGVKYVLKSSVHPLTLDIHVAAQHRHNL